MEGRYEFKDVRPGCYTISANKGSYVGLSYGQQRPVDAPKPIQILDNQTVERLTSLPRGSVIAGRIVDEFGEPMSDVQVAPQQYQSVQGQRRLVPSGRMASTDDMGEFRLFGIPPGQYYLSATWRNQSAMVNGGTQDRTAYAPMYFPGTDNPAQAQRITLAVGQEVTDLVMALKPMRATRVSGTVMTSDGRPMNGMVMAMSAGGFGFNMGSSGPVRPDGTFNINGLAPGEYTLRAQSFGPGGQDAETAVVKITATGDDITDLRIVGAKPSTLSGRIVVDPAAAASLPPALRIGPFPIEPGAMPMGMRPTQMGEDGTFEMKSAPGKMRIMLMNQTAGWTIRAVRLNGADITDSGVECKPNEDISGLEVELTNKVTIISGLVTNARGQTMKEYTAIAFSQDREQWKGRERSAGPAGPFKTRIHDHSGRPTVPRASGPDGPFARVRPAHEPRLQRDQDQGDFHFDPRMLHEDGGPQDRVLKLIPLALSNAHRHASTHSPSTTSRNNDVHRSVPVNHPVRPGFEGVSDTVLTQNAVWLTTDDHFSSVSAAPAPSGNSTSR